MVSVKCTCCCEVQRSETRACSKPSRILTLGHGHGTTERERVANGGGAGGGDGGGGGGSLCSWRARRGGPHASPSYTDRADLRTTAGCSHGGRGTGEGGSSQVHLTASCFCAVCRPHGTCFLGEMSPECILIRRTGKMLPGRWVTQCLSSRYHSTSLARARETGASSMGKGRKGIWLRHAMSCGPSAVLDRSW